MIKFRKPMARPTLRHESRRERLQRCCPNCGARDHFKAECDSLEAYGAPEFAAYVAEYKKENA